MCFIITYLLDTSIYDPFVMLEWLELVFIHLWPMSFIQLIHIFIIIHAFLDIDAWLVTERHDLSFHKHEHKSYRWVMSKSSSLDWSYSPWHTPFAIIKWYLNIMKSITMILPYLLQHDLLHIFHIILTKIWKMKLSYISLVVFELFNRF